MFSLVHAEATSTTTEAVSFGAILACVAHLAEQLTFMLRAVGGVKKFVAHSCVQNGMASE
jgi:hypothetical protein